jgi:hypothetical protein
MAPPVNSPAMSPMSVAQVQMQVRVSQQGVGQPVRPQQKSAENGVLKRTHTSEYEGRSGARGTEQGARPGYPGVGQRQQHGGTGAWSGGSGSGFSGAQGKAQAPQGKLAAVPQPAAPAPRSPAFMLHPREDVNALLRQQLAAARFGGGLSSPAREGAARSAVDRDFTRATHFQLAIYA